MCNCQKPKWGVEIDSGRVVKFISFELAWRYQRANGGRLVRL